MHNTGTTLRYLHHPASQPCRAAHQFMLENDIPFEAELVDITTEINERPDFREKYKPTGQVPILVDGDFVIWESAAIAFYLNEKFKCLDHWRSRGDLLNAAVPNNQCAFPWRTRCPPTNAKVLAYSSSAKRADDIANTQRNQ